MVWEPMKHEMEVITDSAALPFAQRPDITVEMMAFDISEPLFFCPMIGVVERTESVSIYRRPWKAWLLGKRTRKYPRKDNEKHQRRSGAHLRLS
jgi:hypothetical protein